MELSPKERIIVALDGMDRASALSLAERLKGEVWGYKVNDLLLQCGLEIIRELKKLGRVFADPKLHDIPNTVGNSLRVLQDAGADLVTVQASGGKKMMQAAVREAGAARVLAVTILTSLTDDDAQQIYGRKAANGVEHFARAAADAGVHGLVCSPKELSLLGAFPNLIKVTPGVRPSWHGAADDQARTLTPKEAITQGANYLVIGRPITGHTDPREAVRLIQNELSV